jgi:hypothetical protein
MSLRYRRSIKLAPGLKLNVTKSGLGMTVGGKGAHYSLHTGGRRTTSVGLPGTGLYYQKRATVGNSKVDKGRTVPGQPAASVASSLSGHAVGSTSNALNVTSENYTKMRDQLNLLFEQRKELEVTLKGAKSKRSGLAFATFLSYLWIFGFFYKGIKEKRDQQTGVVADLEKQLAEKVLHLNFGNNSQITETWSACIAAFQKLMASQKIWDVTYTQAIDKVQARSYASNIINRTLLKSSADPIEFISSDVECLAIPNANGTDIYIYPTFLMLFKNYQEFGIYDLKEIKSNLQLKEFVERDGVPSDTEVIRNTWFKTNKDGTRDKRFNGNYQIPVVKYGDWTIESGNGLQEYYMFSNFQVFIEFAKAYVGHAQILSKIRSKAQ